jgi:hypothetical protein
VQGEAQHKQDPVDHRSAERMAMGVSLDRWERQGGASNAGVS